MWLHCVVCLHWNNYSSSKVIYRAAWDGAYLIFLWSSAGHWQDHTYSASVLTAMCVYLRAFVDVWNQSLIMTASFVSVCTVSAKKRPKCSCKIFCKTLASLIKFDWYKFVVDVVVVVVHSVCVSVYMYVCMSVCVCISVCLYICVSACLCVCISVCLYICISVCLYVCISVCLYVCVQLLILLVALRMVAIHSSQTGYVYLLLTDCLPLTIICNNMHVSVEQ